MDAPTPGPPSWTPDAIFYQIFVDRFARSARVRKPPNLEPWDSPPTPHGFKGGDLLGVVERLDHIEELGANAIYLTPVFASASNHRYHTYDYFQVDPLLGGNDALRELLDAAHARGMRVILDGVFNHTGRGFWQFHHILECGPQSPYIDWFTVKDWPLHAYDGKKKPGYEAWWGLPALPKLNVKHPEVRAFLLEVVRHWTSFGIDGWRLDVPAEIEDPPFWRDFRRTVRAINPEAYLVGEIWHEAPDWVRGDIFDALMNYPLARTITGFCGRSILPRRRPVGHRLRRLGAAEALAEIRHHLGCYHQGCIGSQLNLLGSHDTARFLTVMKGDHSALHLATLLQMTLPGAPCIYYGDEVGMEGEHDPDCRRAFPARERWHEPTWDVFRKAVRLRRREAVLRRGDFHPVLGRAGVLAYLRGGPGRAILVIINAGEKAAVPVLKLPEWALATVAPAELWDERAPAARWKGNATARRLEVEVPGRGARVMRVG